MGISEKGIPLGIWNSTAGEPQPGHKAIFAISPESEIPQINAVGQLSKLITPSFFELESISIAKNVWLDVPFCCKSGLCKLVHFQGQQRSKRYVTPQKA